VPFVERHQIIDGHALGAARGDKAMRLSDPDGRVRINALMAAGSLPASRALADAVVATWPNLKDRWLESAAVGAADRDPLLFLEASFASKDPAFLAAATREGFEINAVSGEEMQKIVNQIIATPKPIADRLSQIIGGVEQNTGHK